MKPLLESIHTLVTQINNPRYIYKDVYQEMVDIQLNYNNQYCPIIFEDNGIDYDTDCLYEALDMIFESELLNYDDKLSFTNELVQSVLEVATPTKVGFGQRIKNKFDNSSFGRRITNSYNYNTAREKGTKLKGTEYLKGIGHDFRDFHTKNVLYNKTVNNKKTSEGSKATNDIIRLVGDTDINRRAIAKHEVDNRTGGVYDKVYNMDYHLNNRPDNKNQTKYRKLYNKLEKTGNQYQKFTNIANSNPNDDVNGITIKDSSRYLLARNKLHPKIINHFDAVDNLHRKVINKQ